jgi:hypothetical protein
VPLDIASGSNSSFRVGRQDRQNPTRNLGNSLLYWLPVGVLANFPSEPRPQRNRYLADPFRLIQLSQSYPRLLFSGPNSKSSKYKHGGLIRSHRAWLDRRQIHLCITVVDVVDLEEDEGSTGTSAHHRVAIFIAITGPQLFIIDSPCTVEVRRLSYRS